MKSKKFDFEEAEDIKEMILEIGEKLDNFQHVEFERVFCFRSFNSKARALARVWSLPRIWQKALSVEASYVIEILSEKFDRLNFEDKQKVLIHELLHIPKTFSGSLVPHECFGKKIDRKTVSRIYKEMKRS